MKKISLLIYLFLIFGCSTTKKSAHLNNYSEQFKEISFCKCVYNGYYDIDKNLAIKIRSVDQSFNNQVVYMLSGNIIDTIVKKESRIMKKDSLSSLTTVSESSAGKRVLTHCLKFYKSRKLDSIARSELKRLKKIKDIDTIIMEKLPSY